MKAIWHADRFFAALEVANYTPQGVPSALIVLGIALTVILHEGGKHFIAVYQAGIAMHQGKTDHPTPFATGGQLVMGMWQTHQLRQFTGNFFSPVFARAGTTFLEKGHSIRGIPIPEFAFCTHWLEGLSSILRNFDNGVCRHSKWRWKEVAKLSDATLRSLPHRANP